MTSFARSIVLIGMMGAGKSSVGRRLHRRTGLQVIDIDELIAFKAGISVPEIFARDGENRFRELETEVLRELALESAAIVVTGGGIVLRQENIAFLKTVGTVIWLDADEEILFERATRRKGRPLLETEDPRATFAEILRNRAPLYSHAADLRINTTEATDDEVADLILQEMETRTAAKR
jgi:shikimate kinase